MLYLSFKSVFKDYPIFSLQDIEKSYPRFNKLNLQNWQKKGYIHKLRSQYYCFTDEQPTEEKKYIIANRIYKPSYVSLETALFYYSLIPEAVFTITSISTLKTNSFKNNAGNFTYNTLGASRFFGYRFVQNELFTFKIAEPEKALLDFLYLKNYITTIDDIVALRLNIVTLKQDFDFQKFCNYANLFNSKVLLRRVELIRKLIYD
jgi:predicted transcriptional regulator of viral defense system